jgi:hypothetical protein
VTLRLRNVDESDGRQSPRCLLDLDFLMVSTILSLCVFHPGVLSILINKLQSFRLTLLFY